jgi:hypothetical protein
MNWGYKILVVYIVFIAGIVTLVYKSSVQNQDLVVEDYYNQELKYQYKIDEAKRADSLKEQVTYTIKNDEVIIKFPGEMRGLPLKANILLYCAKDEQKDIQKEVVTNDAMIHFPIPAGEKGIFTLKITWTVNNTNYYFEQKIIIP